MSGTLYVVATPIGNLEDMTFRAVRVLSEADLIAAEDTRHTRVLLAHYGLGTKMVSYHKFNEAERLDFFMDVLREGKNIALVSDAGTPCISDPGGRLVARAAAEGVEIAAVCGPSAVAAAVSVSGFDGAAFHFAGFLPRTEKETIEKFKHLNGVVVFYESPKRIEKSVAFFARHFPGAQVCLCNDLTKKFEKIYRGSPLRVLEELRENLNAGKGEYAGVIHIKTEGAGAAETNAEPSPSLEAQLVDIMVKADVSLKTAVRTLYESNRARLAKKDVYGASLNIKGLLNG